MDLAVKAAQAAFQPTAPWRTMDPSSRAQLMHKVSLVLLTNYRLLPKIWQFTCVKNTVFKFQLKTSCKILFRVFELNNNDPASGSHSVNTAAVFEDLSFNIFCSNEVSYNLC